MILLEINININNINENGLFTYNPNTQSYIKVFDELKVDYLRILNMKKKALESFLNIIDYNSIVIPDKFLNNKNKPGE